MKGIKQCKSCEMYRIYILTDETGSRTLGSCILGNYDGTNCKDYKNKFIIRM